MQGKFLGLVYRDILDYAVTFENIEKTQAFTHGISESLRLYLIVRQSRKRRGMEINTEERHKVDVAGHDFL